jgi:predicted nucleic acid-binding protein
MTYLVDAIVLSEPTRLRPDEKVVDWLARNEREFVADSIIVGELELGIQLLPRGRKWARLEQWFEALMDRIECLAWDAVVSRRWAQLVAELRKKGHAMPVLDSMIAATALAHRLTIATHNTRDFRHARVPVIDPFA